ncbi:hypothetical protein [Burkholderia pseudomallei]|uniref:hypothetical protein n=1 Tax=Burkholderia pseudomallei TaxID=28450 RepID=UPI002954B667|nr:hypothetical protein [Burkholderia pseudomallei]
MDDIDAIVKAVSSAPVSVILVSPNTQAAAFEKLDVRWGSVSGLLATTAWTGFENAPARQEWIVAGGKLRLIDPRSDSLRRACFRWAATTREME